MPASSPSEEPVYFALSKVLSLLGVFIVTGFYVLRIRYSSNVPAMSVMMACMGLAMMSGLLGGEALALVTGGFTIPAVAAGACAAAAGYSAGSAHGALAAMEGLLAGIMGGLMGAMLGSMSLADHPLLLLLFLDVLFAAVFQLLRLLRGGGTIQEAIERQGGH